MENTTRLKTRAVCEDAEFHERLREAEHSADSRILEARERVRQLAREAPQHRPGLVSPAPTQASWLAAVLAGVTTGYAFGSWVRSRPAQQLPAKFARSR